MAVVDSTEPFNLLVSLEVAHNHLPIPLRPITVEETPALSAINTAEPSPSPSKAASARRQRPTQASGEGSRQASARGNLQVPEERPDKAQQAPAALPPSPGMAPTEAPSAALAAEADVAAAPVVPPLDGRVSLLAFDWRSTSRDALPTAELCTNGTDSVMLQLPAGRHVFRVKLNVPQGGTLSFASEKSLVLGTESTILSMLAQPSARLQLVAVEGMQALSQLIEQKDDQMETTDQLLAALAHRMLNSYDLGLDVGDDLWDALLWSLEQSLDTKWEGVSDAWKKLVGHFASWLRAAARAPPKRPPTIRAFEAENNNASRDADAAAREARPATATDEAPERLNASDVAQAAVANAGSASGSRVQSGATRPSSRPGAKLAARSRDGRGATPSSPRQGRARVASTGPRANNSGKKRGKVNSETSPLPAAESLQPLPEGPQYVGEDG